MKPHEFVVTSYFPISGNLQRVVLIGIMRPRVTFVLAQNGGFVANFAIVGLFRSTT